MREIIKTNAAELTTRPLDTTPMDPYLTKLISEETTEIKDALMAQLSQHLDQIIYRQTISAIKEKNEKKLKELIQKQKFEQMKPRKTIFPVKHTFQAAHPPKPPRNNKSCKLSTPNKLQFKQ